MKPYHVSVRGEKGHVTYHIDAEDPKSALTKVQGMLIKKMRDWMIEAREQTKECHKGGCKN